MAQDNSRFTNIPREKSSSAEQWDNADVHSVCPSVHHVVAAGWAAEVVVGDVPVGKECPRLHLGLWTPPTPPHSSRIHLYWCGWFFHESEFDDIHSYFKFDWYSKAFSFAECNPRSKPPSFQLPQLGIKQVSSYMAGHAMAILATDEMFERCLKITTRPNERNMLRLFSWIGCQSWSLKWIPKTQIW